MRNQIGLDAQQIQKCDEYWKYLCTIYSSNLYFNKNQSSNFNPALDVSKASVHSSRTYFDENKNIVYLGADVYPGIGTEPNNKMSYQACLAHEFAHAERFILGFNRPLKGIYKQIDEAETSLHASFYPDLLQSDRYDLIQDAKQRIQVWEREVFNESSSDR